MRVLVIYAHPLADSLAAALHRVILETLRRGGHQIDDCGHYAESFDPVLSAAERRAYNTASPDLRGVAEHVAVAGRAWRFLETRPLPGDGPAAGRQGRLRA